MLFENLLTSFYTLGAIQGIILVAVLIHRGVRGAHHLFLVSWLALFSYELLQVSQRHLWPTDSQMFFNVVYGVLFYLYIKGVVKPDSLSWRSSIHIGSIAIGLLGQEYINMHIGLAIGFCYSCAAVFYLYANRARIECTGSRRFDMRWLFRLTLWQLGIWVSVLVMLPVNRFLGLPESMLCYLLPTVWLFSLAYFDLVQSTETNGGNTDQANVEDQAAMLGKRAIRPAKYQSSNLDNSVVDALAAEVNLCMASQKHYLNPHLTLRGLAQSLNIAHHDLSQVINQSSEQNFYQFVNKFRVEEAKRMLASGAGKVIDVCYASGFSSQSSFNRIFKESTGMTPTEFRKLKR